MKRQNIKRSIMILKQELTTNIVPNYANTYIMAWNVHLVHDVSMLATLLNFY